MIFKRIMSVVLTIAMLCMMPVFAENPVAADNAANAADTVVAETPVLSQEQINKEATGFIDITPDAPYAEAVKKLVEYGIIAGYPDGTFKPEGEVTRAEMCKMINLTLGYNDIEGAAGFPDVTSNNWFFIYALAAQKQGYVKGYEDNTFRGSNNITRQEVCAILDRILKPLNLNIPVIINDAVSGWAKKHVETIVQNFIMPLEENNTFRATENLKRHELATVLSNMAIGPVKEIEAKVRFFVNGTQYGETQNVMVGNCATIPSDPVSSDVAYKFDGWRQIGAQEVIDVSSMIVEADTDYEAVFIKNSYEVTFYSKGKVHNTQLIEHGENAVKPEDPEVNGYDFIGWALDLNDDTLKLSSYKIEEKTDFYAIFKENKDNRTFVVTFMVDGELYYKQSVKKNEFPEEPIDPDVEGKKFVGWSTKKNGSVVYPEDIAVKSDITYYAVFEDDEDEEEEDENVKKYNVVFWFRGEHYKTVSVEHGETAEAPSLPKLEDNETFYGWSTNYDPSKEDVIELSDYEITRPTDFYSVIVTNRNDSTLMEMLERGNEQLGKIRHGGGLNKEAIDIIRECIECVIEDANDGEIITKTYVRTNYSDKVSEVAYIVNSKMTGIQRSNFTNLLTNTRNIDKDVQDFLIDYFDIDMKV